MRRVLVVILLALTLLIAVYFFNRYWTHRFDNIIRTQASIYRVDPDLVWSIITKRLISAHGRSAKTARSA